MSEYEEEVKVTNDPEYYEQYTREELVEVKEFPGKGKGLVATVGFRKGDVVLTENALACAQNLDERKSGLPCCPMSGKSLEHPLENFKRVLGKDECTECTEELPGLTTVLSGDTYYEAAPKVACMNQEDGCTMYFSSDEARAKAWSHFHVCLCRGSLSEDQRRALSEFEDEDWEQAGVNYSDTMNLALHIFSIAMAAMKRGQDAETAWKPFALMISCPWQRFTFQYLQTDGEIPRALGGNEDDPETRTKEEVLAKATRQMRIIFDTPADHPIINEGRLSRLIGCILLNGQERSPTSPWKEYLAWLGRNGYRRQKKALQKLHTDPGLQQSAHSQGIYRIGACFNHSCEPNVQVTYSEDQDETLVVTALRDIRKGEELFISYIDELKDVETRRAQLRGHYLFECDCTKCRKELGK